MNLLMQGSLVPASVSVQTCRVFMKPVSLGLFDGCV